MGVAELAGLEVGLASSLPDCGLPVAVGAVPVGGTKVGRDTPGGMKLVFDTLLHAFVQRRRIGRIGTPAVLGTFPGLWS